MKKEIKDFDDIETEEDIEEIGIHLFKGVFFAFLFEIIFGAVIWGLIKIITVVIYNVF